MKKELKYIEELDYILHFLATNPYAKEHLSDEEIFERLKSTEKRMTGEWLNKILIKLTNDKYIEQEKTNTKPPFIYKEHRRYKITFDGLVQDELGGYYTIYLENNKLKNIQKWQFRLTLYIGLGAIVASIYYILEIIKFFSKCN